MKKSLRKSLKFLIISIVIVASVFCVDAVREQSFFSAYFPNLEQRLETVRFAFLSKAFSLDRSLKQEYSVAKPDASSDLNETSASDSAKTSSPNSTQTQSSSEQCLRRSIQYIESLRSLSAEMKWKASLFGEKFEGSGKYEEMLDQESLDGVQVVEKSEFSDDSFSRQTLKKYPFGKSSFRFHLKMLRQNSKASDEEDGGENIYEVVCDKDQRTLWTYSSIEGTKNLTQINIEELADTLARLKDSEQAELSQKNVRLPCFISGLPGLGGLAGTLKQILNYYDFDEKVQKTTFNDGTKSVWKLSGRMKKEVRDQLQASLLGDWSEESSEGRELTATFPAHIEIYIGCETPFPYQLKYFSQSDDERQVQNTFFILNFCTFRINTQLVREENFIYRAPYINHERVNERYLKQLIPGIKL